MLNSQGNVRDALDAYRRLRSTQAALSKELGMTPFARVALKASASNAAVDLAALCATPVVDEAANGSEAAAVDVSALAAEKGYDQRLKADPLPRPARESAFRRIGAGNTARTPSVPNEVFGSERFEFWVGTTDQRRHGCLYCRGRVRCL
jgi:hypothetical protein